MKAMQVLTDIAACLCATIAESSVPDVCFCGVVPGDSIVTDYAGNCSDGRQGMAWVRQTLMYPASGVNVVNETVNNCGHAIGMDIEVGMVRPVMVVSDARGNPPTPEAYEAAAGLMNDDALVMLRAMQCCDLLDDLDHIVGTYQPFGPLGGVVGGTWSVAVLLD